MLPGAEPTVHCEGASALHPNKIRHFIAWAEPSVIARERGNLGVAYSDETARVSAARVGQEKRSDTAPLFMCQ